MPTFNEKWGVDPSLWKEVIPFFGNDCDIQLTSESGVCTRGYLVPWSLRQQFAQQVLGYPYVGAGGLMNRRLPESIEYLTDDEDAGYMFANRLTLRGLGGGGEVKGVHVDENGNITFDADADFANKISPRGQLYRDWEWAFFTVEYRTQTYDVLDLDQIVEAYGNHGNDGTSSIDAHEVHRFVVWNDEGKTQMGTVDTAQWIFDRSEAAVGNKQGIPIPSGDVTLTWYDVHPDCYSAKNFKRQQGKYNNHEFLDYDVGELIFDSWRRQRRRSPFGSRTVNLEFRFLLRPNGANHFVNADGNFELVRKKSDRAKTPVRPGNFWALFHHEYIEA